jgi:hypothetical protein
MPHKMMVIGPNNSDEKVAHRVAQPCRPEQQECFERGQLRGAQLQNQHRDEHSEDAVRERAQALRSGSGVKHGRPFPQPSGGDLPARPALEKLP